MIFLFNASILSRRLPFCRGILQFWTTNQKQPESAFAKRNREFKRSWRQIKEIRKKPGQLYNKGSTISWYHILSHIRVHFFVSHIRVWLSSLRVSLSIQIEIWDWVEAFFGQGKRLRQGGRVESRFRGTRTIQYAYWGGECQSERAPAWRENAFLGLCLGLTDSQRYSMYSGRVNSRDIETQRWREKTAKSLSSCWELRAKSSHFSLKEWWFTSIFQRDYYFLEQFFHLLHSDRDRMNREFTENDRNEWRTGHGKNEELRIRGTYNRTNISDRY